MAPGALKTLHWSEVLARLPELLGSCALEFDPKRSAFIGTDESTGERITFTPPRVVPLPDALVDEVEDDSAAAFARRARRRSSREAGATDDLATYLRAYPRELPDQCMILAQAGAVALAMFRGGEPVATKAFKRYVVRGSGRAQPTYLASKGKSRYGSRLRLQNARLLIEETNEKLTALWKEHGAPDQILVGAPPRLWADLFLAPNRPPFTKDTPITRVPIDVEVPTTSVLLRTYRSLLYGRLERDSN